MLNPEELEFLNMLEDIYQLPKAERNHSDLYRLLRIVMKQQIALTKLMQRLYER